MAQNVLGRYLLFGGDVYYPGGGWKDFIATSSVLDRMMETLRDHKGQLSWGTWYQIYDTIREEIIYEERNLDY